MTLGLRKFAVSYKSSKCGLMLTRLKGVKDSVIKEVPFQVDVPHLILSLDGLHVQFEN